MATKTLTDIRTFFKDAFEGNGDFFIEGVDMSALNYKHDKTARALLIIPGSTGRPYAAETTYQIEIYYADTVSKNTAHTTDGDHAFIVTKFDSMQEGLDNLFQSTFQADNDIYLNPANPVVNYTRLWDQANEGLAVVKIEMEVNAKNRLCW